MRIESGKTKVIILIVVCVSYIQTSELCAIKNPFLKKLSTSMKLYTSPVSDNTDNKCSYEWKIHKTCCSYQNILDYIAQDGKSIKYGKEYISDYTLSIATNVQKMLPDLNRLEFDPSSATMAKELKLNLMKTSADLIKLVSSDKFNKSSDQCWNRMARIRAESMCSTCSGNSQDYFFQDKALITQEVCSVAIKDCIIYFENNQIVMTYLDNILTELNRIRERANNNTAIPRIYSALRFMFRVLQGDMSYLIDEYMKVRATKNENRIKKAESILCYHFLSLNDKPYIRKSLRSYWMMSITFEYSARDLGPELDKLTTPMKCILLDNNSDEYYWKRRFSPHIDSIRKVSLNSARRLQVSNYASSSARQTESDTQVFPFNGNTWVSGVSVSVSPEFLHKKEAMHINLKKVFP